MVTKLPCYKFLNLARDSTVKGPLPVCNTSFIFTMRIRGQYAALLYEEVMENGRKWILSTELSGDPLPKIFKAYVWLKGIPISFQVEERMLRAGHQAVDSIASVTLPRWKIKKLTRIIEDKLIKIINEVPVFIMDGWGHDKIGKLKIPKVVLNPYLLEEDYTDIDREVSKVLNGEKEKTGAILYGPPGNGKSFLIRHFAFKYKLPLYILTFTPKMTNHDLIRMFGRLRGPAIVMLEDFDNYFKGRHIAFTKAEFTFDTILNVLDGAYASPEKVVFFMTANKIEDVDPALCCRPSRFRYVKEIAAPDW